MDHAVKRMTLDEFLPWEERQPYRYELVNGHVTMTAGGSQAHAMIALGKYARRCAAGRAVRRALTFGL